MTFDILNNLYFNAVPTDLDFAMYFNIAFFSILGLGLLAGYLKGFRKAMWSFVVTFIFIVFFFYTIDLAVEFLWTLQIPGLGTGLANLDPIFSSVTSLSEALPLAIQTYLPEQSIIAANENVLEFATSLSLFVVKIVYAILYFTIIQILYRLILWIVKSLVVPSKKKSDKFKAKNRGLGALVGLLQGGVSLYVTLIIFGGVMSISQSMTNLIPESQPMQVNETSYVHDFRPATSPVLDMAEETSPFVLPDVEGIEEATELLNDMVAAYSNNYVVTYSDMLTITSPYNEEEQMPLNLYLFDSVLSMNYQEEQIAIRAEIDILTEMAGEVMESDFMTTNELNDLQGSEVRNVFSTMAESNLFTTVIPVGIEALSEVNEVPLDLPIEELYEIDWATEIAQLGEVAAIALDIVNASGLASEPDMSTVQLDGDDVGQLFTELGDSQLATLGAYVAVDSLLEDASEDLNAFITVPDDINWEDEFDAIGALASSVLNAGLTVGTINDGEIGPMLTVLSDIDFTILIDSKIMTNAMINILSGETSVELPEFFVVPDDIEWHNTTSGSSVVYGEIYNILSAVNALTNSAAGLDFDDLENIGLTTISNFSANDINALFESEILVASITNFIKNDLSLGEDFNLVLIDDVFDSKGYLKKTELQNIVTASLMMVDNLACDVGDTVCEEIGVDFGKIFTLDSDDLDTLFDSDILYATVADLLVTQTRGEAGEDDLLVIPGSAYTSLNVDSLPQDFISKEEIKNAFLAITALGISNMDDISMDMTIIHNLALDSDPTVLDQDKADDLFGSLILNATISKFLFDFSDGEDAILVVPYIAEDDITDIRVLDSDGVTEYVSDDELTNLLGAILVLNLQDFEEMDTLDLNTIIEKKSTLLESSIIQATISDQIINLAAGTIIIPEVQEDNSTEVIVTTGTGSEETTYIVTDELESLFDALQVLGLTDLDSFTGGFDLTKLAVPGTIPTLIESTIIQATISDQVIAMDGDSGSATPVVVPYQNPEGTVNLRRTVGVSNPCELVIKSEIENLLNAFVSLGFTDIDSVQSTITMGNLNANKETIFNSYIIQATVSKQIIDLESSEIEVPYWSDNSVTPDQLRYTSGLNNTEFIEKQELINLMDALSVFIDSESSVTSFAGDIDMSDFYDAGPRTTLLNSYILQASISKQIISMGDTAIEVPFLEDDDLTKIRISVGTGIENTEYVTDDELHALFEALELFGVTDVSTFNAAALSFDMFLPSHAGYQANQTTLLASSSIQATISSQILDLGTLITVPSQDVTSVTVQLTTSLGTDYVTVPEIKALFDALDVLGLNSVNGFDGSIDLSLLGTSANQDTLLTSAIMHATLSDKILDTTLIVPDEDINRSVDIRLTVLTQEFIEKIEMKALLTSLNELGMADYNNMALSLSTIFTKDMNIVLASASIQATMSDNFLTSAKTYALAASGEFIVPQALREAITVETVSEYWIEINELKAIIESLKTIGISNFNVSIGGNALNGKTPTEVATIFNSGSMHMTVEKMIKENNNLNTNIPDITGQVVIQDLLYGLSDIVTKQETINFVIALNTFGGSISADFDASALNALNATERTAVITSAIARAKLTPELVNILTLNGGTPAYEVVDTPAPICLTIASAEDALTYIPLP